jgi:hypothetical protein
MAEQRRADGAGNKADRVNTEGLQYPNQRVGFGEIQIRKDERATRT